MEKLTLVDQPRCMGNQAVIHGLSELAEVGKDKNVYQANEMYLCVDEVHQLNRFGKHVNLRESSWQMNQSQDENIRSHKIKNHTEKGFAI